MLSILTVIHNRYQVRIDDDGRQRPLAPRFVRRLAESVRACGIRAELIAVDAGSTDRPVAEWLALEARDLPTKTLSIPAKNWSRGAGINLAARSAEGDMLAIFDCDMLIPPAVLLRGVETGALGGAYAPYYHRYHKPEERQWSWGIGTGNIILSRAVFREIGGWPEMPGAGPDDTAFTHKVRAVVPVVREYAFGLFHLWHPKVKV